MNIHVQFGFNHICNFWEEGIWTFSNQTAQEWSLEGPLQSFCILCRSEIQDGRHRRT
jgi:hypothetical protein